MTDHAEDARLQRVLYLVLVIAFIHTLEEYVWPGGFADWLRSDHPEFAHAVTPAWITHLLLLFWTIALTSAVIVGVRAPAFALSIPATMIVNALAHLAGSIKAGGYTPGVVTALLLCAPVSLYAYRLFMKSGRATIAAVVISAVLGIWFQLMPVVYFKLSAT
jgi:hypothetical protein